ncbi:MAG: hypothetical protein GY754_26640 [bacterium]|nr:hypothetical protein [bacterium]
MEINDIEKKMTVWKRMTLALLFINCFLIAGGVYLFISMPKSSLDKIEIKKGTSSMILNETSLTFTKDGKSRISILAGDEARIQLHKDDKKFMLFLVSDSVSGFNIHYNGNSTNMGIFQTRPMLEIFDGKQLTRLPQNNAPQTVEELKKASTK